MPLVTYFLPGTDSEVRLTLEDVSGVAVTGGTATAEVYSPTGALVGTGVALSHLGSGVWKLPVSADWSISGSDYIEGEFVAVISMTYSGVDLVKRVRYPVMFDDDS